MALLASIKYNIWQPYRHYINKTDTEDYKYGVLLIGSYISVSFAFYVNWLAFIGFIACLKEASNIKTHLLNYSVNAHTVEWEQKLV